LKSNNQWLIGRYPSQTEDSESRDNQHSFISLDDNGPTNRCRRNISRMFRWIEEIIQNRESMFYSLIK